MSLESGGLSRRGEVRVGVDITVAPLILLWLVGYFIKVAQGSARLAPSSRLVLRRFQPPHHFSYSSSNILFMQNLYGVRNAPRLASLSPQDGDTISG